MGSFKELIQDFETGNSEKIAAYALVVAG